MMSNQQNGIGCALTCWGISAVGGVLVAALLMLLGGWTFLQGVFGGFVAFVIAGALLSWILCRPLPALPSDAGASQTSATSASHSGAAGSGAAASVAAASESASAETASADAAASSSGAISSGGAPADASSSAETGRIKASTPLAGEAELAERKGSWRYGEDAGASGGESDAGATSATTAEPATVDSASDTQGTADFDGDGELEGTNEGTKPEMLAGPRDGGADNLKEIKGIGPKLEQLVNSMGVYHFDQIAQWTPDEVAWVNANLTGFKGRVTRDDWIAQAKILAAGGETEFSQRVEEGGVYDE